MHAASGLSGVAATAGFPFFHLGVLAHLGALEIQWFGAIVAVGVLIGASLLRRYAEWHGLSDYHIRHLLGWVTICGFIGAHEFDMIAYNWAHISDPIGLWPPSHWPLPIRFWDGIASYGGFVGGAAGFAFYVWWKRLPPRLMADITIMGLLPAFSIGRIGCTVVSDHIGAAVDPGKWYSFLAVNYPVKDGFPQISQLVEQHPEVVHGGHVLAWNLGLIEFLYLALICAIVLSLAFRPKHRPSAGFLTALTGALYTPVRFFLDFLRPEDTDPRHLGLTFAQWVSILAFGIAVYAIIRVMTHGEPAEPVTETSGEAQRALRTLLTDKAAGQASAAKGGGAAVAAKDDDDDDDDDAASSGSGSAKRSKSGT